MSLEKATPIVEIIRDADERATLVLIGNKPVRITEQQNEMVFVECDESALQGLRMTDFPGDIRASTSTFDVWRFLDDKMCFLVFCEPGDELERWGREALFDAILDQVRASPMFEWVACYPGFISLEAYVPVNGTIAEAVVAIEEKLRELVSAADRALEVRETS